MEKSPQEYHLLIFSFPLLGSWHKDEVIPLVRPTMSNSVHGALSLVILFYVVKEFSFQGLSAPGLGLHVHTHQAEPTKHSQPILISPATTLQVLLGSVSLMNFSDKTTISVKKRLTRQKGKSL